MNYYATHRIHKAEAMQVIKGIFPEAKVDRLNLIFFSTSGIHGSYTSIQSIEHLLHHPDERTDYRENWNDLTFVILRPRIVQTLYGNVPITSQEDVDYIKTLEASMQSILCE